MRLVGEIGPAAADAVPGLIQVLKDANADIYLRVQAADTLDRIGPKARAAVPALVAATIDKEERYFARPPFAS